MHLRSYFSASSSETPPSSHLAVAAQLSPIAWTAGPSNHRGGVVVRAERVSARLQPNTRVVHQLRRARYSKFTVSFFEGASFRRTPGSRVGRG